MFSCVPWGVLVYLWPVGDLGWLPLCGICASQHGWADAAEWWVACCTLGYAAGLLCDWLFSLSGLVLVTWSLIMLKIH